MKWYAALAFFVLFTALVVWLPRPQAAPAVVTVPPSPGSVADMPPTRPNSTPAEYDDMLQYTAQNGDTVSSIARLFAVSEEDLRSANRIPANGEITPGDKIWIPVT